jgi:CheY-like chemotaxis protein
MVIKKVLNNLDIECDEAENGLVSVELHRAGNDYDLILMDKEMPVMDGHEVSSRINSLLRDVPRVRGSGFWELGVDFLETQDSGAWG